jgi:uncharacterized protein with HEPN domain
MRTRRAYQDYLHDIWDAVREIEEFVAGKTWDDFKLDKMVRHAVRDELAIIGEAAKKIPPTLRRKYSQIPWRDLGDMRNMITHEYFGINLQVIWKMATERLPEYKPFIAKAVEEADAELFDKLGG